MIQMALPMARQMLERYRSYADRIGRGEFANLEAFGQVMLQDIQAMFQEIMGGQGFTPPGQ